MSLMDRKMSDVAYIDAAEQWSKDLTRMKARGRNGDIDGAMRQIEREYGVDYWTIWKLCYRRSTIKDIGVSIYMRLQAAYQAECAKQLRKLQHEIQSRKPSPGLIAMLFARLRLWWERVRNKQ